MVTSYVVVAIPSKDDYIWNISSEKVPHLTLMYLDAHFEDAGRVEEFIQHVVATSLSKFYMEVNRRGVLGDQSADVLFLEGYDLKMLEDFRRYLLNDSDIFKAYNSVEQYPKWTPHLTLGYPETPAKPDKRDYPGIHSISFDRIALWTGDYEGVEFPLNRQGSSLEMSAARGEEFLAHFGIKGMRWGVNKIRENPVVKYASISEDHKKAHAVRMKSKIAGVNTLSNKDLQAIIKRMDLEVKFKDLKTVQHNQSIIGKGKSWVGRVVTDILVGTAVSWLRRPGFSRSRYSATKPDGPIKTQAWVGTPTPIKNPVRIIEGSVVQKAIGS